MNNYYFINIYIYILQFSILIKTIINNFFKLKKKYKTVLLNICNIHKLFYIFFIKKDNTIFDLIKNNNFLKSYKTILNNYYFLNNNIYLQNKKYSFLYKNNNNYFFWSNFSNDPVIKMLLNLVTKKGRKHSSYKIIFNCLFFFKQITGLQPIILLRKMLYKNRILFDIKLLLSRKKKITFPKLLNLKSQITKTFSFLFNKFNFNNLRINKKNISFYKKLSFLILNVLFNKKYLKNIINKDISILKNSFFYIEKEMYLNKYRRREREIDKPRKFRLKYKSRTKKDKYLWRRNKNIIFFIKGGLRNNNVIYKTYNINILTKIKSKYRWF